MEVSTEAIFWGSIRVENQNYLVEDKKHMKKYSFTILLLLGTMTLIPKHYKLTKTTPKLCLNYRNTWRKEAAIHMALIVLQQSLLSTRRSTKAQSPRGTPRPQRHLGSEGPWGRPASSHPSSPWVPRYYSIRWSCRGHPCLALLGNANSFAHHVLFCHTPGPSSWPYHPVGKTYKEFA